MAVSREWLVQLLNTLGYEQAAEEAASVLPETITMEQLVEFGNQHGISRGELVDRMGGSP